MPHEFEARMIVQMVNVSLGSCEKIVDAENIVPLVKQTVDKM